MKNELTTEQTAAVHLQRIYESIGIGVDARTPSVLMTCLGNLKRRTACLDAVEREFFTKEVPDEDTPGETVEECALSWGDEPRQYVEHFRAVIAAHEALQAGLEPVARVVHRAIPAGHDTPTETTFDVEWLGIDPFKWAGDLYAAPQPTPDKDAEIAALRKDAERYRWLRSIGRAQVSVLGHSAGDAMDAAIDKAMACGQDKYSTAMTQAVQPRALTADEQSVMQAAQRDGIEVAHIGKAVQS